MFHSLSEMIQALHVQEMEDVADVEPLINCARLRLGDATGELFRQIYEKRKACYKTGELLLHEEYAIMRDEIRIANSEIEKLVLADSTYENRSDERPSERRS